MKYTNFEIIFLKMLICKECVYLQVSGNYYEPFNKEETTE